MIRILKMALIAMFFIGIFDFSKALAQEETKNLITNNQIYQIGNHGPNKGIIFFIDTSGNHGMEAKPSDEPETLSWPDAHQLSSSETNGWRLPTINELELLYQQRKSIGGFKNEDYWSKTEQDINSAWIKGFGLGDQDRYNKHSRINVRLVREF